MTEYTYDEGNHNLLEAKLHCVDVNGSANSANFIAGVNYTYNNPVAQLKKITRSDHQEYNFLYDIWGRVTDIKVGNKLLSHSAYKKTHSNDTQLAYTEYGNGAKIYYTYDWLDRIVAQSTTDPENGGTPYVSYDYNSEGLVGRVTDNLAYNTTEYHYDLLGRLVSSNMSSGAFDRFVYSYDQSNNLTGMSAFPHSGYLGVDCTYSYEEGSGRLTSSVLGEYTVSYTYDVLDRVTCEKAVHDDGTEYYTYYTYLTVGSNTTSFVSAVTYKTKAVGATTETVVGSVHYTYDSNGFISSVTNKNEFGAVISTESYTYDALGQLKTVTNGNNVTEYTYDTVGNISSKTVNGTTVGSYTYGDSQWKDLLTSYNGQTITYDAIGNPTKYIGNTAMTWDMGRRLVALSNANADAEYFYNAAGQRIKKYVDAIPTEFYYDDRGSLILLAHEDYAIYFYPDADGSIGSFSYNNEQYYYVRNAQNDVIGITDKNGNFVAKYTYDEWGKILTITDGNGVDVSTNETHIANLNPFRYRSYYYDSETGFYYTVGRYYDPTIGRWISAEPNLFYGGFDQGAGLKSYNVFAYCANNPITYIDPTGEFILTAIIVGVITGAVIGGVVGGTAAYKSAKSSGKEGVDLFKSTASGVVKGSIIGGVVGGLVGATGGVIATYGATSVAGTAMITTTATITAKATEVTALQVKKSSNDGDNGWETTSDCIDSIFNNGVKILSPVATKTATTCATYVATDIIKHKVVPLGFNTFLHSTGGKILPYGFAALAWGGTAYSILCSDPIARANQKGYSLR